MGIPNKFVSMAKKKCPNCRKGDMYCNKSIFPLKDMMNMPEHCPNCGMKYEIEVGFWFGGSTFRVWDDRVVESGVFEGWGKVCLSALDAGVGAG